MRGDFMKLFKWYFQSNLLIRILLGLLLGAVCGIVFGTKMMWVHPLGEIFVRMLKMIVMPVIGFTLTVGAASVHPAQLGRVGVKALGIYMITTAFAVVSGLLFGNLFEPGKGMTIAGDAVAGAKLDVVTPSLISEDEQISKSGESVFRFFNGGAEIMYLVVRWILQFAPIGVFALIAEVFGKQGAEAFGHLGFTTLAVYCAFAGHLVLVYGGLLLFFKINPILFFNKAKEAIVTAFVTRSSGGTLPVSMKVACR